jgi:hypothetical protein
MRSFRPGRCVWGALLRECEYVSGTRRATSKFINMRATMDFRSPGFSRTGATPIGGGRDGPAAARDADEASNAAVGKARPVTGREQESLSPGPRLGSGRGFAQQVKLPPHP